MRVGRGVGAAGLVSWLELTRKDLAVAVKEGEKGGQGF